MIPNKSTMKTEEPRRIILTVDAASHFPSTIELAVALAVLRNSTLHGLFVEDADLIQVAELPFTQEVSLLGARSRSLDHDQLQRSLNQLAQRFQRLLASAAERSSLSYSHSTVRGRRHALDLSESSHAEFLIVGPARPAKIPVHPTLRILLLGGDNPLLLPTLETIVERAQPRQLELLMLTEEGIEYDSNFISTLRGNHPELIMNGVSEERIAQVLGSQRHPVDYVVAGREGPSGALAEVLRSASCPVIILSALPSANQ
jgi:hypothetical protein